MAYMSALLDQSIPIGVSSKYFEHRELECQPLFDDKIYLIVPAHHPWAAYGKATPDDLMDQPIIMREETSGTCETVMQGTQGIWHYARHAECVDGTQ
jgi:DNA-binding transcriptional LysR family regulator